METIDTFAEMDIRLKGASLDSPSPSLGPSRGGDAEEVGSFWTDNATADDDAGAGAKAAGEEGEEEGKSAGGLDAPGDRHSTEPKAASTSTAATTASVTPSSSSSLSAMNHSFSGKEGTQKPEGGTGEGGASNSSSSRWRLLNMMKNPFGVQGTNQTSLETGSAFSANTSTEMKTPPSASRKERDRDRDAGGSGSSSKAPRYTYHNFIDKIRKPQAKAQARKLNQFVKRHMSLPTIGEQEMRVIHRFINEMHAGVAHNMLWKGADEQELDNVFESLEKCILMKLYPKVFYAGPAEEAADLALERQIFTHQFLKPENLDITKTFHDQPVWELAQRELKRMNQYKSPRDKIVCLLNCCKVILNLLKVAKEKAAGAETIDPEKLKKKPGLLPSADDFLPILIYMVLKAQVPHLHLNIRYIEIARHPRKLSGEAAYYFTNLKSAVAFIERIDPAMLTIDRKEYETQLSQARKEWETNARNQKLKTRDEAMAKEGGGEPSKSLSPLPADKAGGTNVSPGNLSESSGGGASADAKKLTFDHFPFYKTTANELKVGDIPRLLEEYKRMTRLLIKLQASGRTITYTPATSIPVKGSAGGNGSGFIAGLFK